MAKTTSPCQNCGTPSRFRFCHSCLPPLGDWSTCPLVGGHSKAYMRQYHLLMRLSTADEIRSVRVKVRLPPKLREVIVCEHGIPGRCAPCAKEYRGAQKRQWRLSNPEMHAQHRARENEKRRGNRRTSRQDNSPPLGPCFCGKPLASSSRSWVTCGDVECTKAYTRRLNRSMRQQKNPSYMAARRAARQRRRAKEKQVVRVEYRIEDICERDDWRCHLCNKKIPRDAKYPNPLMASPDHLIPISHKGDDAPWNVKASHLGCNISKNAKAVGEQLMLIG
jgi:hypothetical protein